VQNGTRTGTAMSDRKGGADKENLRAPALRPAAALFAEALAHLQAGRLAQAEQLCRQILAVQPRNADGLHLLGLIARKAGQDETGVGLIRQAIGLNPGVAAFHFNLGHVLVDQHRPEEAAASYSQAIALKPDHVRAHLHLGKVLQTLNRLDDAADCFRRALALKPDHAEACSNLGDVLQDQGKLAEAAAAYREAIARKPDFAAAYNNLGNTAAKLGEAQEAMDGYRRALALEPGFAIAHYNFGNALAEQGQMDHAVASYRRALGLSPDFAEAHFGLARVLKQHGQLRQAEASFRRGLAIRPDAPVECSELASTLLAQGQLVQAFEAIQQSLQIRETEIARRVFVDCVQHTHWNRVSGDLQPLLKRALTEPWAHPSALAQSCAGFLKQDPQIGPVIARAAAAWPEPLASHSLFGPEGPAGAGNPLLEALLCTTPNADMEMERFLTMARRLLLETALTGAEENGGALNFYSALARQCFINEYVFYAPENEIAAAHKLGASVAELLASGRPVPALCLLAIAAYFPLYSLAGGCRLLEGVWPEPVRAVLAQQIEQPLEESRLRAAIPRLTAIDDEISKLVQDQYEENPYPRWVKAAPVAPAGSLTGYLHRKFPLTVPQAGEDQRFEILVAGCGTGQHPIETARCFPQARLLAIDLSANSLAYARYKTGQMGLAAIEYAQADILALGGLDRRFDLIESIGVLHHLGDVLAGWRVLLTLLAPGGFMRLALYSQTARSNIAKARAFVAQRAYGTSADAIRQARQDIAAWDDRPAAEAILNSPDFFSVSNCRDLIFHAQEHGMTIAGIATFLRDNGLAFLGFDLGSDVLDAYRRRFPNDPAAIDLGQWERFESENPNIFAGMYHFWTRKRA